MKSLYTSNLLRRLILPLFARFNPGDISIKHHYTGDKFQLHSFKHKGYWFHGENREKTTMMLFEKFIKQGATVVEVGGHIGYISLFFAKLVGESGQVIVFEPGPNNLPYLLENTSRHTHIVVKQSAVSDTEGELPFYVEELTGQNNTLIKDFGTFTENKKVAHINTDYDYNARMVNVVTLDGTLPQLIERLEFIKIDVEGAELGVLQGAVNIIEKYKPIIMVESNSNGESLYKFFESIDYVPFSPNYGMIHNGKTMEHGNFFCIHLPSHPDEFAELSKIVD